MNIRMLMVFVCLCPQVLLSQLGSVSGYVVDAETGETLIGVNVVVRSTLRGTATNGNGYFVLGGLTPGKVVLDFRHIGYEKKVVSVVLSGKSRLLDDIAMRPQAIEMQNVSIVAEKSELADPVLEAGHRAITSEAIRRIPAGGEDVFRAVKYLPGIEGIDPFSPLYVVRGSDTGENLILLDGVPIYNPYHYVSASGLFNVYALKHVEMMVGGFGAEYGGRNGSVLYLTTREGNNKAVHGEFTVGTSHANGVIDFPLGGRSTVMLSGRFYSSLESLFLFNAPTYFYDMNGTVTLRIDARNRLALRLFHSFDRLDFQSETYFNYLRNTFDTDLFDHYDFALKTRWRNQAVSLIWKTIPHPNVYWQTRVYHSSFSADNRSLIDYQYVAEDQDKIRLYMETEILGAIRDLGVHTRMDIHTGGWNQLKIGGEWNRYRFENDILLNGTSEGELLNRPDQWAVFVEDKIDAGRMSVRPGLRFTRFGPIGGWSRELRISASLRLSDRIRFKSSIGEYLQPIVSVNTQEYEISQFLDTYYPLTGRQPGRTHMFTVGAEAQLTDALELSMDVYQKDILRTYGFDYNAGPLVADAFLDKLRAGSGGAYGVELLLKGRAGGASGWISYGWCRSERRYPHIMNGRSHPFDYDRPHAFKAVLNYQVHPALEFSGTFRFLSGTPKTLQTGYASYFYFDPTTNQIGLWPHVITPVKNNIRMPAFIQLDLGLKKRLRTGFGADLAKYLGAEDAFLNVTFGNLLFLFHRNVWFYLNLNEELYGVGSNYLPEISAGYSIRF